MPATACHLRAAELVALGYACTTASLSWNAQTGKKRVSYMPGWQRATLANCLREFVAEDANALAIITGEPSDLIVVDVDNLKPGEKGKLQDGNGAIDGLIQTGGLPPNVPIARTGSGGRHFFFSLSQSMAHGLLNTQNRSKMLVNGRPTTIDARADGGNIFVEPTSYRAEGRAKSYEFMGDHPLCPVEELPPMPAWLIDVFNADKGDQASSACASTSTALGKRSRDILDPVTDDVFCRRVRPAVEKYMCNSIERCYTRPNGFDFSLVDKNVACKGCTNHHMSNHYRCRQVFTDCFTIRNYSQKCRTMIFEYEDHPIVRKIIEQPCVDNVYCHMLQDVERYEGKEIRVTGDKKMFYQFDGDHWRLVDETTIQRALRLTAYNALEMLTGALAAQYKANEDQKIKDEKLRLHLKQLNAGKAFVQRAGNIAAITTSAKQLWWDIDLAARLDKDPDLLGVPSGVVDLRTGEHRRGRQDDHVSRVIETDYKGIDHPTPDIDAFFWSLFEDQTLVDYLQCILGYAITGRVSEQMWLICHGVGSNGKGVMQRCLQRLLGDYYCVMSPDCLIKRGRPEGKSAAKPYLADLCGARLAICDELPEDAVLDEEMIKRATGDSTIEARYYHSNPIKFDPTHFSVLLCNHKPKINIDDEAMLRRLLFVPFDLRFKKSHEMDHDDPTHRPIDPRLAEKLATEECREQLLTWLVRGAVRWAREGLGEAPPRMKAALQAYLDENDEIGQFIASECHVDRTVRVESARLLSAFNSFKADSNTPMTAKVFKKKIIKKGFPYKHAKIDGIASMCVFGVCLS